MTNSSQASGNTLPAQRGGPLGIYLTKRARDFDALLGCGSLLFAAGGQVTVFGPLIGTGILSKSAVIPFFFPWIMVFFLNFTNRPPFPPRLTFRCWLFASCWYAVLTITAEVLYFYGRLPIKTHYHTSEDYYIPRALHALMHIGWLSFIPLIRYLIFNRGEKI